MYVLCDLDIHTAKAGGQVPPFINVELPDVVFVPYVVLVLR